MLCLSILWRVLEPRKNLFREYSQEERKERACARAGIGRAGPSDGEARVIPARQCVSWTEQVGTDHL